MTQPGSRLDGRTFGAWEDLSTAIARRLDRWSRWRFVATGTLLSLALSLFFFSPKFWLLTQPVPGSFEWSRALTFLHQCQSPFATDIEGAMRWRLLPPLAAHVLGLTGSAALIIPYLGLVSLVAYWCAASERLMGDRLAALLLTLLLTTSAAVITVTTLFGINDGWFLLGLVAVAAGRGRLSLILPCLLAPWVDERFFFGLGLALFCRWWLRERPPRFVASVVTAGLALLPYVLIRLGYSFFASDRGSASFVSAALKIVPVYLPYFRIGMWMGYRAAWLLILLAAHDWWRRGGRTAFGVGSAAAVAGLAAIILLAADLSRSTNLLLPALLCGGVALTRSCGSLPQTRAWLGAGALINLLIPFTTVIYTNVVMIWGFPLELLRFLKHH